MSPCRGPLPATVAALATGGLGFALCVAVLFPGWLSYDSSFQFWQVRTGEFSNLSPVVMTALWSVVHAIVPHASALFVLHLGLYWTGLVLLATALWRGAAARCAFLVGIGFLPPAVVVLGHLWTDASLIAVMSLASGLTVFGLAHPSRWPLMLALPLLLYAGAVRHNSLLAIVPIAALWAHAWLGPPAAGASRAPGWRRRARIAGVALLIALASFGGGRALDQALARERVSTWALLALWDLAAISLDTGTLVVPEFARQPDTDLAALRVKFSPTTCVPLFDGPGRVRHGLGEELFDSTELAALRRAWLRAIAASPGAYLRHRAAVAKHQFGSYRGHREGLFFVPATVPYRDNPPGEATLTAWREPLVEAVRRARGWLVFTPALYLAAAVAALALGWRRRCEAEGQVAIALAASGLALVLPLVVAAPGTELRYSGWLFTSSVVALVAGFSGCGSQAPLSTQRW